MTMKNKKQVDDTSSDGGLAASDAITRKLRSFYSSVQDQGIPERFLDLLEKLDDAERNNPESGK